MKQWIILKEVNAYDQFGKYFVAFFNEKPTFKILKETFKEEIDDKTLRHIVRGGGRRKTEDFWYTLRELEPNKNYDENQY